MKVSVSSYSYNALISTGKMKYEDVFEKAYKAGFDAVELVEMGWPTGNAMQEFAMKMVQKSKEYGIPISNFTFGADFIGGSNGDVTAEIERVKKMIDIAEVLGVKSVRHDAACSPGKWRSFGLALPHIADACREVTEYAAKKGIRTMVENHGYFCQDSTRVEQLFCAVNHPNFSLLTDMGNFLCADENPAEAVGRVAPYAYYVHAKDFHIKNAEGPNPGEAFFRTRNGTYLRGAILGQGNVPVLTCLTALRRVGFDGYIAIEFEGIEDTETALKIALDNLRKYWAAAE